MFFNRNSSLPPIDPYTSLPRGRSSLPEQPLANHLRTTSASFTELPTRTSKQSKRHTYHELQASTPAAWNRVVSLPSTHETFSRGRSHHPSNARSLKQQTPSLGDKPLLAHSRRLENTDPRALLRTLNTLLNPQTQRIPDYLDVDNLMALHERDLMEREQRDAIKVKARTDRAKDSVVCSGLTAFGSSLREATMYASHGTVLCGYEHDLPIVVFRCVQELCRHGYRNLTPQVKPDRERLLALISAFDSEPHFGWKTPLDCPHELREICALLTTYLFALPDPLLGAEMFEALWAWCVLPSLRRTDFLEDENRFRCHVPADAGVHIAQLLLRLLPLPNFSLVVYMMGFFKRLPHMVSEDVGRAVFAGRSASASNMSDGRAERAETMLRWFLDRWDAILKELFPLRNLYQKEGVPTRSNNPWSPRESYGDYFGSVPPVLGTRADAELTPRVGQNGGNEPPAKERGKLLFFGGHGHIIDSSFSPAHASTL
ncbi:hypothetical protein B0H11DRAFT_1261666 [Mycena galericulata]|nr:hypothetical protein B0H11DRAFT_1261666 [Mycena galericulata]